MIYNIVIYFVLLGIAIASLFNEKYAKCGVVSVRLSRY